MTRVAMMNGERVDGASLRDPTGMVFHKDGQIWRRMRGDDARQWLAWSNTPEAAQLFEDGSIIRTTVESVQDDACGCELLLSHERVEWLSYAQEWSFSMLRDAALLHLRLMERLLPSGWILKDAHSANVQWHAGRMLFIDVASVQPYRGGAWRAYGQFCQTMLFPLLASAYGGMPMNMLLKGAGRNGIDAKLTSRLLPASATFRPGVFTHVQLQRILQRFIDRFGMPSVSHEQIAAVSSQALLDMVRRLRVTLERMPIPKATTWTGYVQTSTYSSEQLEHKKQVVSRWLATHVDAGAVVLDVGCNTGVFSRLSAARARQVISIDADMPCIDEIWRSAPANILPLVVDFADETPASGWALGEQRAFSDRVRADASLWLAVIHHLAIHNGIRLPEVCRGILNSSRILMVEFVDPEDEMVKALLAERGIDRPDYTRAGFLQCVASEGGEVLDLEVLSPTRQIYLIRSRP